MGSSIFRRLIGENKQGFSLIEILIAIMILGVGLLGVLSLIPIGSQKIHVANMEAKALNLAQLGIERARAFAYENLNDTNLNIPCPDAGEESPGVPYTYETYGCINGYPEFSRKYTVNQARDQENNIIPNVRMVTVTVKFRLQMKSNLSDVAERSVYLVDYIGLAFKQR